MSPLPRSEPRWERTGQSRFDPASIDFRSPASRSKTDWELLISIANGVLFTPMHSFRGKLTDEQILDVLSYIQSRIPPDIVS
ncbi:MAG: hypothetical protein NNA18_09420 [Nitrospira sp.]|nr:hypothetical protein [Nitrospira sp.]